MVHFFWPTLYRLKSICQCDVFWTQFDRELVPWIRRESRDCFKGWRDVCTFDNDFRLPLVITYTWVRQIRYFICLPEDVYMIRVQIFGLCKRTYGDDDDDDDDDAAAELIIICSIISSRLEIAANNTS